jgi:hypothetical protein
LSDTFHNTVRELLAQSLLAWGLTGSVQVEGEVEGEGGAILLSCNATGIRIEPAPAGVPFRWMVTVNGRKRGAISLVAVLRQVRGALDPGYAMTPVRIAALAPMPQ